MEKFGIETLKETIDDVLEIVPDVKAAKESGGKITWLEGGALVVKHGGKAVRFISNIEEIGNELIDLDSPESEELFDDLKDHFGGSDEAKEAIKKLLSGVANISQGIQGLLALKKAGE